MSKTIGLKYELIEDGYVIVDGKRQITNVTDGVEITSSDYVVGKD